MTLFNQVTTGAGSVVRRLREGGRIRHGPPQLAVGAWLKQNRRALGIGLLALAVLAAYMVYSVTTALWTVIQGVQTPMSEPVPVPRPGENINVLFLGLDAVVDSTGRVNLDAPLRSSRSRTDTMMLITVDPATNEAALISIPRDSRCLIPGRGWEKAAHAHAYGGPTLAMKTVELMLGIDVHYYVRTNYHGVEAIVNALGGVALEVEKRMYYEDPYQDLLIDLEPGVQVLDGDKSLQYLRYRNEGGDIARIARQQKFISALVDKVTTFSTVFRANALAKEAVKYIDTNMSTSEILEYGVLAARITDPNIVMETLPGRVQNVSDNGGPALSYWVLDEAGTRDIVDRLVWRIDKEANAQITVRVLNGSGQAGEAARMAERLAADGFEVVDIANAPETGHETTQIISHIGDQAVSDAVARSVMRYVDEPEALRDVIDDPPADVTVIVGRDFSVASR